MGLLARIVNDVRVILIDCLCLFVCIVCLFVCLFDCF